MLPFFKYSGGKRKEAPVVDRLKPEKFDTFYEPFLGGGAIWLHLEHPKNVVNDNYPDVMNFYKVLRDDTSKFVSEINTLSLEYGNEIKAAAKDKKIEDELHSLQKTKAKLDDLSYKKMSSAFALLKKVQFKEAEGSDDNLESLINVDKDHHDDVLKQLSKHIEAVKQIRASIRDTKKRLNENVYEIADRYYYHYRDNEFDNNFDKAISFYLMRQLSFSGMLRFSADGKFNIPYGWYKSLKGIDQPIDDIKRMLNNSTLLCGSWKDSVATATKNDFVFLDPPYTREFTEYHPAGQFGDKEHEELANWFKNTEAQTMIIINRDEFTESLYKDYIVEDYDYRYSIQYRDRMTEKDSNAKHFVAINNYEPAR